ncbi:MAG: hypothetical protein RH947_12070 [Alcanivorax sp.]
MTDRNEALEALFSLGHCSLEDVRGLSDGDLNSFLALCAHWSDLAQREFSSRRKCMTSKGGQQ